MNQKLRGRIVEKFGTIGHFSEQLGVSKATISKVLHGKKKVKGVERAGWCVYLGIPLDEAGIFFDLEDEKMQF